MTRVTLYNLLLYPQHMTISEQHLTFAVCVSAYVAFSYAFRDSPKEKEEDLL